MPVFFVVIAPRSLTLESLRTRQRKPLLSMSASSLFLLCRFCFALCSALAPLGRSLQSKTKPE